MYAMPVSGGGLRTYKCNRQKLGGRQKKNSTIPYTVSTLYIPWTAHWRAVHKQKKIITHNFSLIISHLLHLNKKNLHFSTKVQLEAIQTTAKAAITPPPPAPTNPLPKPAAPVSTCQPTAKASSTG